MSAICGRGQLREKKLQSPIQAGTRSAGQYIQGGVSFNAKQQWI